MPWRAISYAPKALDCRTQAQYMCLLVQCVTLRPELGTRNEGGRQTQSTRNEGGRQTPRTQGQGRLNHLSEACPTSSRSTYLGRPGCSRQSSPGQTSQSRFDQARLTHGVDSTEQWLLCLATASSTRSLPPPCFLHQYIVREGQAANFENDSQCLPMGVGECASGEQR